MIISGYRAGAETIKAAIAISKHTGKTLLESKRIIESVIEGKPVTLPDDFVLREDLEDLGFRID